MLSLIKAMTLASSVNLPHDFLRQTIQEVLIGFLPAEVVAGSRNFKVVPPSLKHRDGGNVEWHHGDSSIEWSRSRRPFRPSGLIVNDGKWSHFLNGVEEPANPEVENSSSGSERGLFGMNESKIHCCWFLRVVHVIPAPRCDFLFLVELLVIIALGPLNDATSVLLNGRTHTTMTIVEFAVI